MSESRINSIGKRLRDHLTGESKNQGIAGYKKKWELNFTCLDDEFFRHIFPEHKTEMIETYFLEDFARNYGSYPICNNRRGGIKVFGSSMPKDSPEIDWKFFEDATHGT